MEWKCQYKEGCDSGAFDNSNFCKKHKYNPDFITKLSFTTQYFIVLSRRDITLNELNSELSKTTVKNHLRLVWTEAPSIEEADAGANRLYFDLKDNSAMTPEIILVKDNNAEKRIAIEEAKGNKFEFKSELWIQNQKVEILAFRKGF
ncbi:MAG TPA: hypothetical protein VGC97_25565 [Pyrinomonadaceae bacterium]|jgi:hypothetical protein